MSKKILSLALAVVMLFSVCAIAASAVNGDGTENIRIYITTDATVGTPAGKPVNVSYYIDLPDGVDELQMGIGNIALGYNSSKYAVNTDGSSGEGFAEDALTWGDNFGQYMKPTCRVTIKDSISNSIVGNFNSNDEAKGWDKALQVQMLYDGTNSTQSKGFPVGDNEHIFTLQFVTLDTLTAEDVIGVVEGAYGKSTFKICYFNGSKAVAYDLAQINMADAARVAPAAAAVEYDVKNIMGKNGAIADKHLNGDGTCTVAVFYGFDSALIDPDFDDNGTSNSIEAITATVTATVGEQSATKTADSIRFVYDLGSGMYGFRVIIKNVDVNADVVVTPALTLNGTVDYSVETVRFNVSAAEAL